MGNFGKLFVVAKREYMERVRSRWFIVMTLLVPAIFSGAMLLPRVRRGTEQRVGERAPQHRHSRRERYGPRRADRHDAQDRFDIWGRSADSIAPRVIVTTTADLPARERELQAQVKQPNNLSAIWC